MGGNGEVNGNGDGRGGERKNARWERERERGREREQRGCRLVDQHRTRRGTGVGTETRAIAEMGTRTITKMGLGRTEETRRSARNYTRVVDAMWARKGWCSSCQPK